MNFDIPSAQEGVNLEQKGKKRLSTEVIELLTKAGVDVNEVREIIANNEQMTQYEKTWDQMLGDAKQEEVEWKETTLLKNTALDIISRTDLPEEEKKVYSEKIAALTEPAIKRLENEIHPPEHGLDA